jgi:pimeloyl-ACP methyl ester carboxylesterase
LEDLSFSAVAHPTLVVRGSSDLWCSEAYADSLVAGLPAARQESLPGVGRLVAEENPTALVDSILAHAFASPLLQLGDDERSASRSVDSSSGDGA